MKVILFDIDGTLLHTGGAGAVAWQRAFLELYEVEANIAEHTHAGMTDPEIAQIVFREVLKRPGSATERAEAIGCYLGHLADAVAGGYRAAGGRLPPDWRRRAAIADLGAWAELLSRQHASRALIADARATITRTLDTR